MSFTDFLIIFVTIILFSGVSNSEFNSLEERVQTIEQGLISP